MVERESCIPIFVQFCFGGIIYNYFFLSPSVLSLSLSLSVSEPARIRNTKSRESHLPPLLSVSRR